MPQLPELAQPTNRLTNLKLTFSAELKRALVLMLGPTAQPAPSFRSVAAFQLALKRFSRGRRKPEPQWLHLTFAQFCAGTRRATFDGDEMFRLVAVSGTPHTTYKRTRGFCLQFNG